MEAERVCRLTSAEHALKAITTVVVTLTVLSTEPLRRVSSADQYGITLTLATDTLAAGRTTTWQTVVCSNNVNTYTHASVSFHWHDDLHGVCPCYHVLPSVSNTLILC